MERAAREHEECIGELEYGQSADAMRRARAILDVATDEDVLTALHNVVEMHPMATESRSNKETKDPLQHISGLTMVDASSLDEFRKTMTEEVIPEIVKAVEGRRLLERMGAEIADYRAVIRDIDALGEQYYDVGLSMRAHIEHLDGGRPR